MTDKPAEPVIEVAPGEQPCPDCGGTSEDGHGFCLDKDQLRPARAMPAQEAPRGERFWLLHFDDAEKALEVFTEEAPARRRYESAKYNWNCKLFAEVESSPACHPAEPQAGAQVATCACKCISCRGGRCVECKEYWKDRHPIGAQVPSQDAASVALAGVKEAIYSEWEHRAFSDPRFIWQWMLDRAAASEARLNSIKSYATEAAKTPITSEDMHDPLKAQTFFDEANGFWRLVLAEIGGGK